MQSVQSVDRQLQAVQSVQFQVYLEPKKNKVQISIFPVNPFGNITNMVTLKIGYFHSPESLSFHLKNQQTLFLGLFITKTKVKFQFFNLNRGLTALEKSFIRRLYKLDIFIVQKAFLYILNISKHYFQVYLEQKETKFKFQFFNFGKRTNNGDSGNRTFSQSRTPFFPSKTSANTIFESI